MSPLSNGNNIGIQNQGAVPLGQKNTVNINMNIMNIGLQGNQLMDVNR